MSGEESAEGTQHDPAEHFTERRPPYGVYCYDCEKYVRLNENAR